MNAGLQSDIRRLTILALLLLLSGCRSAPFSRKVSHSEIELVSFERSSRRTIYVVGHGWHTGLVLQRADVSPEVWPEIADFPDQEYVEIGWGDEGFYRATSINVPLVLKAAFWPTPSVLHVAGFRDSVYEFYPHSDIVEVELSTDEFDGMCRFVSESVARDDQQQALQLGPGIYGESRFYRGKGKYYFPKTCNIWTANALKAAGRPIVPQFATTAENVLKQTRRFGHVLQESPRGLKRAMLSGDDG